MATVEEKAKVDVDNKTAVADDKKPEAIKVEATLAGITVSAETKPKTEEAPSVKQAEPNLASSSPATSTTDKPVEKAPTSTDTKSEENKQTEPSPKVESAVKSATQGDDSKPVDNKPTVVESKDQSEKKDSLEAKKEDSDKKEDKASTEPATLKVLAAAVPVVADKDSKPVDQKAEKDKPAEPNTVVEAIADAIANKTEESLKPVLSIRPRYPVLSMALLNQDQLITGSVYSEIHLWSLSDGRFVRVINESEWCGCVFSLQVHGDNQHILAGTEVGKVNVFRIDNGALVIGVPAHASPINALLLTKNNKNEEILVTGSYDSTIKLWQLIQIDHWKCLRVLKGHQSNVLASLAISDNQYRLVSGSGDGHLSVWDIETGERIKDIDTKSGSVDALLVDEKKGYVISGHGNGEIKAWNIEKGECLKTLATEHKGDVGALVFDASGKIVSGGQDGKVKAWDLETGKCLNTIEKHRGEVWSLKMDSKGRLVSSAHDGTIRVWQLP